MKKICSYKKWGIFQNNPKEITEYGFPITILHPDNMDYTYMCSPSDSDMEMQTVDAAKSWINNYNNDVTQNALPSARQLKKICVTNKKGA